MIRKSLTLSMAGVWRKTTCALRSSAGYFFARIILQLPRNNIINRLMLVCICNAISEQDLRAVAREGQTCPEAAYAALGKTPDCRICLEHAEDILTEEQSEARRRQCPGRAAAMRMTASLSIA